MRKSDLQKVARVTLITSFCALLFLVVVLVVSNLLNDKYISGAYNGITPIPTSVPFESSNQFCELVFVSEEDGSLSGLYLSELDCVNLKWRLSRIPLDSRLTLSVPLYKEALKLNVATPQIATVSELYKCFTAEDVVSFMVKALDEVIPVKINSSLVLPDSVFSSIVKANPENYAYSYFLADELEETIIGKGGLQRYISEITASAVSSTKLKDRLYYLESFEGLTKLDVHSRLIPGEKHNNGYEIKCFTSDFFNMTDGD